MGLYTTFHSKIIPPLFLLIFTAAGQFLTLYGRNQSITLSAVVKHSLGNTSAWFTVYVYVFWSFLFLKLPSRKVTAPALPSGFIPQFQANGFLFFWTTLTVFGTLFLLKPDYAVNIYQNVPQLFGAINILGLVLCFWLLAKGKLFPEELPEDGATTEGSLVFDFYRGVELHPTIFGVSIKQLIICRFGVMGWQLLSLIYFVAATQTHGFSYPFFVSTFVQLVYTLKFFLYESTGYFDSIDIAFDRAGYYLIWGSMVWMPGFYGLHSYNFVVNPPKTSPSLSLFYLAVGVAAIILEYRIDYEKYLVRSSKTPPMMYGKPAEFILAEYTAQNGNKQKSKLVVSGFWGLARHLNYVLEVIIYISFTLPSINSGIIPFMLPIFMIILLTHRLFRDEQKSKKKYGKYWDLYCSKVPYKLIPWIY